ncbi:transmembrane emp24 domain-containing protein 5 [Trichonephila inaurata madagascariensis]|uniref:Transmembrane emp24 domain-containing protein 5 n=1 Tax=Trichonephila inaurata madagascariensis TaxID=2747483 RepID=A0A8X6XSR7_9ARAC|nr:transmembrane emp24 domain-containing protein 5 [Trichonephila inaurata madagascariensis]
MAFRQWVLYCILVLFCLQCMVYAHEPNFNLADMEFITKVTAKSKECFYQYAKPKQTLRFQYQVVDSGFSKLDISRDMTISFYVRSPDNKIVVKDLKKSHAIKKYDITRAGDYQMCLDNSFSQYSSKTVYFEVSIDVNSEGYRWTMMNELLEADKKRNDTISRLKRTVNKVKDDLENIKHHQDTFRAVEARDINIQEKNLTKVNAFSSLTTVFMMLFGSLHLCILKSMFNRKSLVYKIFRLLC